MRQDKQIKQSKMLDKGLHIPIIAIIVNGKHQLKDKY